ncbi:TPA: hypothetical protein ACV7YI_003158 [Escherichia coli]
MTTQTIKATITNIVTVGASTTIGGKGAHLNHHYGDHAFPTGTRKAGLRKFRNPPPHNVLNNHYKPLIKLNYRESRELGFSVW